MLAMMVSKSRAAPRPVTSYDVARAAGVSQSAVSRCFTPGASVAAATRDRIVKAANELGYRPNAIARSLITRRSNMVAIIVANIGFLPEFTALLSRGFGERGLHVLLFTLDHEADADRVIDQIQQYRVDGVVAAVQLPPQHVERLARRGTPLVSLNRFYPGQPVNIVACDQIEGERLLVDRLLAAGHASFGVIQGPEDSAVSSQRVEEVLARLRAAGVHDVTLARGQFDYDSGRTALRALVAERGCAPEALICANDMMALGAMDAARHEFGLRVPGDVSIVGFDGVAQAGWSSYDLVTIRQPIGAMVDAAIEMLLARVASPGLTPERRMFSGALVEGSSARLG